MSERKPLHILQLVKNIAALSMLAERLKSMIRNENLLCARQMDSGEYAHHAHQADHVLQYMEVGSMDRHGRRAGSTSREEIRESAAKKSCS